MFPNRFQTQRLVLRTIDHADAEPIFRRYAQDAKVTRYLTWRPHSWIEETQAYVAKCIGADADRTYVIVKRGENEVIGAFGLRQTARFRLDFGYVLARSEWGQGLMTEVLTAVVDWALNQPDIWRIGGVCDVDNSASARVMEKAGLIREGVLRRWIVHRNISAEPRDCFSYAKVR